MRQNWYTPPRKYGISRVKGLGLWLIKNRWPFKDQKPIFFPEMKRDLPYDAFRAMELGIKHSGFENFREPHCDIAGNRKGTIIAFTSKTGVIQLFAMLSGKKE
mgnify:FL=1